MNGAVPRLILAILCLVGIVFGGALAPAIGVETPVPDLGVEESDERSIGEFLLVDNESAVDGQSPESGTDTGETAGEFVDDGGAPVNSGAESYGGVGSGGYPEENLIGGPLSLSSQEELRIESPEPSRWRLGAYATYTGTGWERDTGPSEPLTGPLSTVDGTSTPTHEIRVTPQRSFTALATAWRPAYATAPAREISVTEERGLVVANPVTAGDTYVTSTYGAPSHAVAADAAGEGSAPAEIHDRYTQLPDDTPERLSEKTAAITADAETSYETAAAVQLWLTANKEYSLDADHDRDNDVATEFVFEMDSGYCQYFATSMVAMLRTQEVPARYVTGYGPGEEVGDDEYVVRGQDAHAWVEVYITDVGWVTFDPTPPDGRAEAGRDAIPLDDGPINGPAGRVDDQASGMEDPGSNEGSSQEDSGNTESDDPNETEEQDSAADSTNESEETETEDSPTGDTDENNSAAETPPLEIELAADPVPGQDLTVTVTQGGDPVSGVTVFFNSEPIGETDATGNVTGEVPYTASLEVVARTDNTGTPASLPGPDVLLLGAGKTTGTVASEHTESFRQFAAGDGVAAIVRTSDTPTNTSGNVTVDVPVDITIDVVGVPVAGESVALIATVAGEPVQNGTVQINETTVAQTGPNGQATASLPETETAVLTVSRGDATGSQTLSVGHFTLSTAPSTGLPLPLAPTAVNATFDDEPVESATITVNGESTAVTDANGTGAVTLPFTDSVNITATASIGGTSASTTTTIGGLYRNLVATVGALLIGLGTVGIGARRRGITPMSIPRSVANLVVRLVRFGITGIVWFAATVDATLSTLRRWLSTAVVLLTQGLSGARQLVLAIITGSRRTLVRLITAFRAMPQYLHPLVLLATLKRMWQSSDDVAADRRSGPSHGVTTRSETTDELLTIRDAWSEFREHVSIRPWHSATPGEIARWAVQRDNLPQDAVQTLTNVFREVEYGSRSPRDRAAAAQHAIEAIRSATDSDEETKKEEAE